MIPFFIPLRDRRPGEKDPTWREIVVILLGVLAAFWIFLTILDWATDMRRRTLLEIVGLQFEFVWDLLHRIW